ncbi:MAG: chemotaxis response regulator protein-glutamate methylesterase [Alteromonadaceae bacterium]|nr:MAG: chemotaxis response regulator protein-glutamate methylesterase [Alteromonadaceae bacterium]
MRIDASKKIKVLIVDDSALIRALLTEMLGGDPRLEVVACAKDAYEARELIKVHDPDVLTLDIEMPKMNGITFLKNLMRLRPMPVVMISTLTQTGAPATLEALELGAVDFFGKPKADTKDAIEVYSHAIIDKVVAAARINIRSVADRPAHILGGNKNRSVNEKLIEDRKLRNGFICAIGGSTGGTEAIKEVVAAMPVNSPPLVVTQHIPESFSRSFAARVDSLSAVTVCEAEHDQRILRGHVYIAPGHSHMRIVRSTSGYVCKLEAGQHVNRHRPSVEVLFDSVVACAGKRAVGVILTGMGADGSEALLRMRELGCLTVAQDEKTSVVWGMPGVAVKINAAEKILPLDNISNAILNAAFM